MILPSTHQGQNPLFSDQFKQKQSKRDDQPTRGFMLKPVSFPEPPRCKVQMEGFGSELQRFLN